MRQVFLGRPVHWALLVLIAAVLWVVGEVHWHVSFFNRYSAVVFALSLGAVALVVFAHRRGELVTREPPPDESVELPDE